MGYLVDTSQTFTYEESKIFLEYIKKHGIIQFLNLYSKFKNFSQAQTYWGDEVELHLLNIDPTTKLPRLQINNEYLFTKFSTEDFSFELHPECGSWMVEAVPKKPYAFDGNPFPLLESLIERREKIMSACREGDVLFAGTVFPLLHVGDFYVPKESNVSSVFTTSTSASLEDTESTKTLDSSMDSTDQCVKSHNVLISPHPRYSTLCENIKQRRGGDICILLPLYKDEKTNMTQEDPEEPYPGFIHMKDTLFGMGDTSMQFTFGTRNIGEARYLTDQMHVFSSIILPLSAATAVVKGKLSDFDVRWNLLCPSVDCRTPEERDPSHANYVPKSRWSSISRYISDRPQCKEAYNDIYCPLNKEIMKFAEEQAKEMGLEIDEQLLKHLGFLFVRDPLAIFVDRVYVDDTQCTNHFENIQSTNWNNVRFKPPPNFESQVGWRVELRTGEAQLTAEEGTALGMFSYFVAAMIMKKEYNFYIPISKVDENIARGQKRDAILNEKFWFRKDVRKDSADEWAELTIDEILHGKEGVFVGLFRLIYEFCKEEYGVDMQAEWARKKEDSEMEISKVAENMRYFEILSKRARGEIPTIAKWMRLFVLKHPEYKKDSIVGPEIVSDLVSAMTEISDRRKGYADFL